MKFYCIEFNQCGWMIKDPEDPSIAEELICPECYSPLLMYENNTVPEHLEKTIKVNQNDSEGD